MSIHPGWPDLNNTKRASLMRWIGLCDQRINAVRSAIEIFEKLSCGISEVSFEGILPSLQELKRLLELQFPEVRICDGEHNPEMVLRSMAYPKRRLDQLDQRVMAIINMPLIEYLDFLELRVVQTARLKSLKARYDAAIRIEQEEYEQCEKESA